MLNLKLKKMKEKRSLRSKLLIVIVVVVAGLFLILAKNLFETNYQGKYQVKQAFISGKMSAMMSPGTYG